MSTDFQCVCQFQGLFQCQLVFRLKPSQCHCQCAFVKRKIIFHNFKWHFLNFSLLKLKCLPSESHALNCVSITVSVISLSWDQFWMWFTNSFPWIDQFLGEHQTHIFVTSFGCLLQFQFDFFFFSLNRTDLTVQQIWLLPQFWVPFSNLKSQLNQN